jgi:hypothetical protein
LPNEPEVRLETHHGEIAAAMDAFLGRTLARR